MVVDDSVVIRGMISRWIDAEPDMEVSASLRTGLDAVNQLDRVKPDVAVLDIEMPELDGISALPKLLAKKRDLVIIMASTLTRRNAEISFKALSLGASDYIPKPESTREATAAGFRFVGESNVLRNPKDPLNIPVFDRSIRGHTSQFALKFRKPAR